VVNSAFFDAKLFIIAGFFHVKVGSIFCIRSGNFDAVVKRPFNKTGYNNSGFFKINAVISYVCLAIMTTVILYFYSQLPLVNTVPDCCQKLLFAV